MSTDFDNDIEDVIREESVESQAANNSRITGKWKNLELQPWSFLRKTAAFVLGLAYGYLDAEDIKDVKNPAFDILQDSIAEYDFLVARSGDSERIAELKAFIDGLGEQPETVQKYDGMARDVAIVLWLRCAPDDQVRKARRNPRAFEKVVDDWAEKNDVIVEGTLEADQEAINIFTETMNEVGTSLYKPSIEGSAEKN